MNVTGLLPYQVPAVAALLDALAKRGSALDASDCGVGKSFHAAAVIREFNLPTLVLAPQISLTAWGRVGEAMGVEFNVLNPEMVRTGKTPFGTWEFPKPPGRLPEELWCSSCQLKIELPDPRPCPHHRLGIHCAIVKKKSHRYGKFSWSPEIKFLVFDEAQRYSAKDSLNCDLMIAAKRQRIPTLSLSATACDSPLGMRALGYSLGLHGLTDFYTFCFRHGCKKSPFGGLMFGGDDSDRRANMGKLHASIFPSRGVRVRIKDLGTAFPECRIQTELYDLAETKKIDALYAQMDEAVRQLNGLRAGDAVEHPLTQILRARQELELVMVPVFEELTRQALENGAHVAVFINFKQTMDELSRRLKTSCRIVGGQTPAERQACIDGFQADKEPVILANNAAGGVSVSLHDIRGEFHRVGVASLGLSATQTRQVFGRLPRAGGKSKVLYRVPLIAGTVQEKVHRALAAKLDRIDALNDADLWAANLSLTKHSVSSLFPD